MANLSHQQGLAARSLVSAAAATAPKDETAWKEWLRDLQQKWSDSVVFIFAVTPESPDFRSLCLDLGLPWQEVLAAFAEGSRWFKEDSKEEPGIAMARMTSDKGNRALLILRPGPSLLGPPPTPLSSIFFIILFLSLILAGASAYVASYFLLVRPITLALNAAQRVLWTGKRPKKSDIASLLDHMEALVASEKEAKRQQERLNFELKRIREDLKGAQASLLRAEKLASVGQLAAGISHEIGNPIGIILGFADLIANGTVEDPKEIREYAKHILESAQRVDSIIRDLLRFARPERDETARADVRRVVQDTLRLLSPQKKFRKISVVQDLEEAPLEVEIRGSQLEQVLVNLLLNAAEAMGGEGQITIRAFREDRFVVIEVEDQGPGIPPEEREKVFDPFYTTKPPGEGTGLGLAISAQIIRVYGGEIEALEGRLGKGARFRIRLWQAE